MSQAVFARFLGVDANTVRSWEQGQRPPSPIARRFMGEVEVDPEYWRRRIAQCASEDRTEIP
jgi:DNA-binding transcriptional regulator YiaG